MSSGELRHYVQLESISLGTVAAGDYASAEGWGIVASVWASIKYSAQDEDSDGRDSTQQKAMIKIRHRSDVSNKMRVTFGNQVFDIEDSFDPTGKGQYLMLNCVVSDGSPAVAAAIIAAGNNKIRTDITGGGTYFGVLAGAVDGANTVFTVSAGQYKSGSLSISDSGADIGEEFTETDSTAGTITLDYAPVTGSLIKVRYEI